MGHSKEKKVKQKDIPEGNAVKVSANPDSYYSKHPSWNFQSCDKECWSIFSDKVRELFWNELLPRMQDLEKDTWSSILLTGKIESMCYR